MLTTSLSARVSRSVQHKGEKYYRQKRVTIQDASGEHVHAEVRGSEYYDVNLHLDGDTIKMSCDCPYFEGIGAACKHIWATLLAADARGYLTLAQPSYSLSLEVDDGRFIEDVDERTQQNTTRSWKAPSPSKANKKAKQNPPSWKRSLDEIARDANTQANSYSVRDDKQNAWSDRQLLYVIDLPATLAQGTIVMEVPHRFRKLDGEWSKPKLQSIHNTDLPFLPDPTDLHLVSLLMNCNEYYGYGYSYDRTLSRKVVPAQLYEKLLPVVAGTGRFFLKTNAANYDQLDPLAWDEGPPWKLEFEWNKGPRGKEMLVSTALVRGEERLPLAEPKAVLGSGMLVFANRLARFDFGGAWEWVRMFRKQPVLTVPLSQKDQFLEELFKMRRLPFGELPAEFEVNEKSVPTRPKLTVRAPQYSFRNTRLEADLHHVYDAIEIPDTKDGGVLYSAAERTLIRRDTEREHAARERLKQLGLRWEQSYRNPHWDIVSSKLPKLIRTLIGEGWLVVAEGKLYRTAGEIKIEVSTGIDWFGLDGSVDFEGESISLPKLLQALRKGDGIVQLGDGSFGMLPEDWLKKYGVFANVGSTEGDQIRFSKAQVGLLDALLATQENAKLDDAFRQARDRFRSFEGVRGVDPPKQFQGELRGYQREGLGWLQFLEEFGWGGCLADDMGLGKTVQVLALLGQRALKRAKGTPRTSLVVVPRSLIFNWQAEAARFAPWIKILDHSGADRPKDASAFDEYDLVLTTYGILRRDALLFKDCRFDYCILDESQAIKNASTEQAKAVRLLQGNHRLAMSGTPVENHLGELWSLFEFLNPGMLGQASVFKMTGAGARNPEPETRELLAKALRPFILRRTKAQVANDLPEKTEQTVFCELESEQRKAYNELRDYYRAALLSKIASDGINKAKIMVLEALLRLRQAACHPGLIDKKKAKDSSAKLDVLMPRLGQVFEEGHKAIVFSQFTTLLGIVKDRLDADNIPYEYLDGRTRDRQARVDRFQNDPDCKLFLISLKAGGVGLNLTAAEYVFLLDPWWNPAVEAQAIDRAHRIGQTRPVFAYRIIARDTVEEKVLELQKSKRALADAIVNADNSLISSLKKEDLELLLS